VRRRLLAAAWLALALVAVVAGTPARADLAAEEVGRVEVLPRPPQPHWVWASDVLLRRSALVDLDSGRTLGILSAGFGPVLALFSETRDEIYVPETHHSRGSRGERSDLLTIYDGASLALVGEVVLPPKRAISANPAGHAALSDDGRFVAVFNLTPATSLSIVDVERRRLVGEIETPGCSLAYAAGPRRFAMLCLDGAMLLLTLDAEGRELSRTRSEPFFDPDADPVTEKAVRAGKEWLFVSFEGHVHPVDVSGEAPRFGQTWSLLDDADRAASWRIGGSQHLALHAATGRLYSLVHQGGPDTHKEAGTEVWVYELAARRREARIRLRSTGITYLGVPIEPGRGWPWPFAGLAGRLVDFALAGLGAESLAVTQDDAPLLAAASAYSGAVAVYDARSGELLRRVYPGNSTVFALQTPFGAGVAR
jgi:methylamine dehydrogenase heavy chain